LDLYTYTFTPPPPKPPKPPKVTGNILTGTYLVTSVIDGDTIKILYSGNEQSVRFLGIDAPEVSLLRTKKKGCFAEEAKDYVKELLLGKEVHLEFDPTQNKADSYKRRLKYVYLDDELLNETLLSNGYAKEYTFKVPYQLRDRFLSAQQEAQDEQLGLWNPSLCPENALQTGNMTGEILTGDLFTGASFSGLSVQITYVLPNPKGKDNKEEIGIWIAAYSS
jgi:endonuclease YncB( thermonuclease family)